MVDDTTFERLKEDLEKMTTRLMADNGNNFEAACETMELALDLVLNEIKDRIYK